MGNCVDKIDLFSQSINVIERTRKERNGERRSTEREREEEEEEEERKKEMQGDQFKCNF